MVFDFVFGGIIMWSFREQKIQTQLTLKEISLRFEKSKQFVVNVEDKKFKMREESFLSNKVCYPIIEGLIDGQDNYTNLIKIYKNKLSIINLKALKFVYTVLIYNLIS